MSDPNTATDNAASIALRPAKGPHMNILGSLFRQVEYLTEKITGYEARLADVERQTTDFEEGTPQIDSPMEVCGPLAVQQRKENVKALTDTDATATNSQVATISFPGGPRTVTIHPPGSPNYRPVVRDDKGEPIINFRRPKPLRREGAFKGPLRDIDWQEITDVYGRDTDLPSVLARPPKSRSPNHSRPHAPPPTRRPSQIITQQDQYFTAYSSTDASERDHIPDILLLDTCSPGGSPLPETVLGLQPGSGEQHDSPVLLAVPLSPSVEKGKKRARKSEDDEEMSAASTTPKEAAPSTGRAVKRGNEVSPETKRKKL